MPKIHLLVNRKGGVGKSTFVAQLAAVTGETLGTDPVTGLPSVAALSADPQGSLGFWMNRVEDKPFDYVQIRNRDDLSTIKQLRDLPYRHIYVDSPGWIELDDDLQLTGDTWIAKLMRALFEVSDDAIVPVEVEPLSWEPTFDTIESVLKPLGLDYVTVVNNWEPRDGNTTTGYPDRDDTITWIDSQGWNRTESTVRHYKVHSQAPRYGLLCTQYRSNRMELNAAMDFYRLAVELGLGKAQPRLSAIEQRLTTGKGSNA
ncbi:ParA family protein [Streptomyces albogriseolus]|uniref:ParA family protein n=1 Tax=Streptomyces albogriseolus TaxID=1887 RepID=UPI00345FB952